MSLGLNHVSRILACATAALTVVCAGCTQPAPGTSGAETSGPTVASARAPDSYGDSGTLPQVAGGATAVSVGYDFACALDAAGTPWCWHSTSGADAFSDTLPTRVTGDDLPRFSMISVGAEHACALSSNGDVWCWGNGARGRTGGARSSSDTAPHRVALPSAATSVSVSVRHTCALGKDGTAWCWGDNTQGQLGVAGLDSSVAPTRVDQTGLLKSIVAGPTYTCGVTEAAVAMCWGRLGVATLNGSKSVSTSTPVAVAQDVRLIRGGEGLVCVLPRTGGVACAGANDFGGLGSGAAGVMSARVQFAPVQGVPSAIDSLSVADAYACALSADGGLWCWGDGRTGQLGDAAVDHCDAGAGRAAACAKKAVHVRAGELFLGVSAMSEVCAINRRRSLECWGGIGPAVRPISLTPART